MNKLTNRRTRARHYELTNHLSNVLTMVNDRIDAATQKNQIENSVAYEPLGRPVSGLSYYKNAANKYKFGFNTQLKDPELGSAMYSAQFWEYDGRLGRRWNVDPVVKPWQSSYSCLGNNPVLMIDPNGDSEFTLSKSGEIKFFAPSTGNDRLIALGDNDKIDYDKKGNIIDNVITLDYGTLSSKKTERTNMTPYTFYVSGSAKNAKAMFEFVAKNSTLEWGVTNYETPKRFSGSVVTTSYERSGDFGSGVIQSNIIKNHWLFKSHMHNHHEGRIISPADFDFASAYEKYNKRTNSPYEPVFKIFYPPLLYRNYKGSDSRSHDIQEVSVIR